MWLNEGFAEYVSNIASHFIDPEIHTWERSHRLYCPISLVVKMCHQF